MNATIEEFSRERLKSRLVELPEGWQNKFKLMYARDGGKRTVEDALAMDIRDVVDKMESSKLDWAMTQVDNSYKSLDKPE